MYGRVLHYQVTVKLKTLLIFDLAMSAAESVRVLSWRNAVTLLVQFAKRTHLVARRNSNALNGELTKKSRKKTPRATAYVSFDCIS